MSSNHTQAAEDYARIEQAIMFLEENYQRQPDLKEVADNVGLSEFHFQRLFSRWAGISPKRFVQFLTVEHAKQLLSESKPLLDVTYEAGLSSPGRLHDLFVTCEAMTPGEYKKQAEGVQIRYGFHNSPFGECLLAVTDRGICGLEFMPSGQREAILADFSQRWSQANLVEASGYTRHFAERVFFPAKDAPPLPLLLKGTNFQLKVWQALLNIPPGAVVSYQDVAQAIDRPTAVRAVGSAVGHNPVAFIIPCHRVIRKAGRVDGYRWGTPRKKAILGWEASQKLAIAA